MRRRDRTTEWIQKNSTVVCSFIISEEMRNAQMREIYQPLTDHLCSAKPCDMFQPSECWNCKISHQINCWGIHNCSIRLAVAEISPKFANSQFEKHSCTFRKAHICIQQNNNFINVTLHSDWYMKPQWKARLHWAGSKGHLVYSWRALGLSKCWSMQVVETTDLPGEFLY